MFDFFAAAKKSEKKRSFFRKKVEDLFEKVRRTFLGLFKFI